mmetsp:Transcript_22412/g.16895  ORF Transcript_22412/g.16895 Transcript_22412/m.16895 type:complete len:140 (-) Transcript_22412:720-1139(-)
MRKKIQDRVSFPLLLNMNDYLKGYEGIQNKLYEKEVERMQQYKKRESEEKKKLETERAMRKREQHERNMMMSEDKIGDPNMDVEMQEIKRPKKEKGLKIGVQSKAEKEEESMEQEEDYRDNPYLYDASGPKRKMDYSMA